MMDRFTNAFLAPLFLLHFGCFLMWIQRPLPSSFPSSVEAFSTSPTTTSSFDKSIVTNIPTMFSSHLTNKQITVDDATTPTTDKITLTYLEINGWLLTMNNGITVLIDPVLEGPLDFGIPTLFKGTKRILPITGLTELLPLQHIDCLLLTQGLDDHAHVSTLTKLWQSPQFPKDIPIVAPSSARLALKQSGWYGSTSNIRFLDHGQTTRIHHRGKNDSGNDNDVTTSSTTDNPPPLLIQATTGALVGPPWQQRENGYILTCASTTSITKQPISLYIEPHVEFYPPELSNYAPVDVVITPTTGQALPAFELVHGPKDCIRLVETLRPRFVVPMPNGDIDTAGLIAPFVTIVGSPTDVVQGVAKTKTNMVMPTIVSVEPGKDIELEL